MKTKINKTIVFSAIAILCLLFMSISSKAIETTLVGYEVDYPKRVREGKTFDIIINFNYTSEALVIYGERSNVWLYTSINDGALTIDTIRRAIDSSADLRPAAITFTINTSVRGYEEGDIFNFRIKYKSGINITTPMIYPFEYTLIFIEDVYTEVYSITIRSTNLIDFSFVSVLIPLLVLATIITLRKIKKVN